MPNELLNGIDVHYEVVGDGPPLLVVNGSASTIDEARPLVGAFAPRFRVAIADARGLGGTSMPEQPYEMADLAADAVALVDHLGWDTFTLLGLSFGGMVAQEIAVTVPERIQRLVLMCTSSGGAGGSSYPLHELAQLDPEERAARSMLLADTRFTPEWLAEHPSVREQLELLAQRRGEPETAAALRGAERQLQARIGHDVYERLPRVSCPTLVASGRYDGIAPPENGARIAARIPGAELRLYDGGHGFYVQDPTALPEILAFVGGAAAEPGPNEGA